MRTLPTTHIAPILRPHCAHIALTLRRSNFPRVRLCIPDRWSGLGLRRAFGAFSALKGRISIQPGFVLKAWPWQRRGADIRMLSGDPQVLPGRTKFLSISFVRQIRLPRFAGEANLPPEFLATHLVGMFLTGNFAGDADSGLTSPGLLLCENRSAWWKDNLGMLCLVNWSIVRWVVRRPI